MKRLALLFFVVLFTMSGCKKEETVVPDYTDIFVGTWRATKISQNGQSVDLVGNTDVALYLKVKVIGTNKVSCSLSQVIQATVTDTDSFELEISKNGNNYDLNDSGKTGTNGGYFRYTTSTGELKIGGVDDKGISTEIIFKK